MITERKKTQKKSLRQLNLLNRFLFAEAMEDPETMQMVLEIILGREVVLKYLPQVEKEERVSPLYRYVRLDVLAEDITDTLYDTEVQQKNTGNLPRRSRHYQAMIDCKLLEPGEVDFNAMSNVYIITIAPFDMFGYGKYMYTFRMKCDEVPELSLEDGAVRIFLNTRGTNGDEVREELIELLRYMEHTDEATSSSCISTRIHEMQKKIEAIKSNEEVGIRFLKEYEALVLERREAREEGWSEGHEEGWSEGHEEGLAAGREEGLVAGREEGWSAGREEGLVAGRKEGLAAGREEGLAVGREEGLAVGREEGLAAGWEEKRRQLVLKKLQKGKSPSAIAEELEEDVEVIREICDSLGKNH